MTDKYSEYRFDTIIQDRKRSFMRKYQDLVVGNGRFGYLLYFEASMLLVNPLQGALGLALRKFLFPPLFRRVGRKVVFGHHVGLRAPGNVEIAARPCGKPQLRGCPAKHQIVVLWCAIEHQSSVSHGLGHIAPG